MKTTITRFFVLFLLTLFVILPSSVMSQVNQPDQAAPPPAKVKSTQPSLMMVNIQEVLERQDTAILSLQQDLKNAVSEQAALGILRAIGQQKQATEIEILGIQKQYALAAGDQGAADRISQAIDHILNPIVIPVSAEAQKESQPLQGRFLKAV